MSYTLRVRVPTDEETVDEAYQSFVDGLQTLNGTLNDRRGAQYFKLDNESEVHLAKTQSHAIEVFFKGDSEQDLIQQMSGLLRQMDSYHKEAFIELATKQQKTAANKAMLSNVNEQLRAELAQQTQQQKSQLNVGRNTSVTPHKETAEHKPLPQSTTELTHELRLNESQAKLVKSRYQAVLQQLLEQANKKRKDDEKLSCESNHEFNDLYTCSLTDSFDNQVEVFIDDQFSARCKVVNQENVDMMIASAKAYLTASGEFAPEAQKGFVLRCETLEQALNLKEQFHQANIPLRDIQISRPTKDNPQIRIEPYPLPQLDDKKNGLELELSDKENTPRPSRSMTV